MDDTHEIPINVLPLFPEIDRLLINLLKSLSPAEWSLSTIAKLWTVKDIASHLLDGNLRTLSFSRDKYFIDPPQNVESYRDLVSYLNQLNADWVKATKRLSFRVITDLLEVTGKQYYEELQRLDPFEESVFPVAWAGEERSLNWFHIAREYTEKFIHQQQIRDTVKTPALLTQQFFCPFLETCMYALPYTYRNLDANDGTSITFIVTTAIGGQWFLVRRTGKWILLKDKPLNCDATISMGPNTAWKLFSKGISPEQAKKEAIITGNQVLAETALTMVSVMA